MRLPHAAPGFLALLACAPPLCGCAMTELDHLATTNWVDRTLTPDAPAAQGALTPAFVPLCATTLLLDNLLVAPAANLPSATADARRFWEADLQGYWAEMGALPIRVVLVPLVAAGSWIGRSSFALEIREDAAWGWPRWGEQWERDEEGRLVGPRRHGEEDGG